MCGKVCFYLAAAFELNAIYSVFELFDDSALSEIGIPTWFMLIPIARER